MIYFWKFWYQCFFLDFNIDFCNRHHPLYSKLSNFFLRSFVLTQVVPLPTHFNSSCNSTLFDLVLLSVSSQLVSCSVITPLGNSDHNGVDVTFKWSCNTYPVKPSKRTIWRYAHANFEKANQLISRTDWTFLHNVSSIDSAWDLWEQKFMSVMEECIPRATISQQRNLPWMNRWIKSKIRKRNRVYSKARTTGCSPLVT